VTPRRREALPRQADVSWWMEEARADPALAVSEPCPPLAGSTRADVVILGGGYTGMWTAWFLKERDRSLDVVLLEAGEHCGGGPSGRNGGFCYGMWEDLPALVRHLGDADAIRLAAGADGSVGEIGEWLRAHDVDAWFTRAGHLTIATSPAQDGAGRELVDASRRLRLDPTMFVELDPDEVRARCGSPVFRAGLLQPRGATLQPARLALGLRRELLARGVRIHERSPVVRFSAGPPVIAETEDGRVTAAQGILGLGAWTSAVRAFHRAIVPRGTYIVITEPAPDKLAEIGWTGGEGLGDWRTALHYFRTTPDGRIAFGAAAATAGLGVGLGPRLRYDPASIAKLVDDFRRFFPSWSDVRLEAAWGGPMDVTALHQPFFGTMPGGALHYGAGFTGGGVGPCHLGGKILSGLALGIEDDATTLPLVHRVPLRFPPEPFRSVGATVAQGAIVRKDEAEDAGRRPGRLTSFLARLPRRMGYELGP
jgi:glycine/D-amino acid oxidase-like deaminating enzyme